jgi:hypothetical protein
MNPGELIYHFVNTIIVTALVATFVLWRYRVGVLAAMRVSDGGELALDVSPVAGARGPAVSIADLRAWEHAAHGRVIMAVLTAVGIAAIPLGAVWLQQSGLPTTPAHILIQSASLLIAGVPMIAVTLALSWRRALRLAAWILAACVVTVVAGSMLQRAITQGSPTTDQLLNAWTFVQLTAVQASVPLLLLLATGAPRIRGVAPMTFVGLFAFGLAPLLGSRLTAWLTTTRAGTDLVLRGGLNVAFIALALPTAWLAWRRLRAVAHAYEAKRLCETELLARVWWLMFCAQVGIELVNSTNRWVVPLGTSAFSYLAFAQLYGWLLMTVGLPTPRPPRRTLLLLRVFGYVARTERLFDRVGSRWRLFGPVTMIAAPDVVARTVDPGDFLRFCTGNLGASFVTSREALDARLQTLDVEPDRDGRFRVNEFCCQNTTWRAAVTALMHRADAVIMDLRGLTAAHGGCEFELQELARRVDMRRVVLVADDTTDRDMIARNMGPAGAERVFTLPTTRDAETDRLFDALLEAAYL